MNHRDRQLLSLSYEFPCMLRFDGCEGGNGEPAHANWPLFGKGIETAGRPVLFRVGEVDFIREHPGQCYLGELSDVEFNGTQVVAGSGVLQVSLLDLDANEIEPVLYRYEVPTQRV